MPTSIWQDLCWRRQFRHWWQEVDERKLNAMVTAIVVLLIVAALVAISTARQSGPFFSFSPQGDLDRERQLDELRTLVGYRNEPRRP
jgi:hypothetical protein